MFLENVQAVLFSLECCLVGRPILFVNFDDELIRQGTIVDHTFSANRKEFSLIALAKRMHDPFGSRASIPGAEATKYLFQFQFGISISIPGSA
jgi:hypothetical protein